MGSTSIKVAAGRRAQCAAEPDSNLSNPTKGDTNGTGSFDFHHQTKCGRRASADSRPDGFGGGDNAYAQGQQTTPDKSLYDRLGGVFAIAAVVDHFSDAVVKKPIVGQKSKNPQLREWHTKNLKRLPGLKFMRTLWVCNVSGGPFQFKATKPGATPLGLEEATVTSGSPRHNSTRSQRNSGGR